MSKTINDNEYLSINISAKEALYKAHKAISEGKEEIFFSARENANASTSQQPSIKGYGVAIWINKEKNPEPTITNEDV